MALNKAIEEGWVFVEKVVISKTLLTEKIGQGEKEAISLAAERKSSLLIDDDNARAYASVLGVENHGTLFVIYLSCLLRSITKVEAKKAFDDMIASGFYVSTQLYSTFLDLLDTLDLTS